MSLEDRTAIDFKTLTVLTTIVVAAAGSGFWLSDKFSELNQKISEGNSKTRDTLVTRFNNMELRLTKLEMRVMSKDPYLKLLPSDQGPKADGE